ncbi:MAG: ABC transporter permease subunit [Oscillospiraceae bacterium]|nr:ABC transporter permease subunit [Oscillospiraceae bacterium]
MDAQKNLALPITPKPKHKRSVWLRLWDTRWLYLILLPGIAFFVIFRYAPMYGIQLAFKKFEIARGITASPWIGLDNFRLLFIDREFFIALKNTFIISYMQLVLFFPFPIILAILLNEVSQRRFKRVLQTVYTFPHFLSWVIVSGIMMNLLSSGGALNNLRMFMGLEKYPFLSDKSIFRFILVFTLNWKEVGWSCILYLAAITAIDPSLYEAAIIDGANRWHRIRYITWPGIQVIIITTLILRVGHTMDAGFDQIINLYNATVMEVSDIIDTYIYRITFQKIPNYGFSTAVGLFKGITNCILLMSVNWICSKSTGTGIL